MARDYYPPIPKPEPSLFKRFVSKAGVVIVLTVTVASMVAGVAVVAGCLSSCATPYYAPLPPAPAPTPDPGPIVIVPPPPIDNTPAPADAVPYAVVKQFEKGMTEEQIIQIVGRDPSNRYPRDVEEGEEPRVDLEWKNASGPAGERRILEVRFIDGAYFNYILS